MHACPAERTNRSRSGQCGFAGLWCITSVWRRYASGASAIAVPGWPAFACCTESIASVRMVSIERCSMSVFATKHLVELLLPFPGRTICLCPVPTRLEPAPERRVGGLEAEPLERRDGGAAQRRLRNGRDGHGSCERVGHDLDPAGLGEQGAAGRDELLDLGEQVGDRCEPERDPLERGLAQVERRGVEGQAGDGALRVGVPAGRALAAEERQESETVVVGTAIREGALARRERLVQPAVEVAAVRERAPL